MRSHRAFVVGLLVSIGSPAVAQTTRIEHQGVACAVAEKFPRLEAGVSPIESVAIARVLFQGTSPEWYSVAMKAEGGSFVGVLPKPKSSLKSFRYYIEVTDKALGTTRTPEFSTTVIESSGACRGILAGALGSASVVLQGPAGVVALPGGFASTGVVAGSAAGSTAGASGAAAAGGGGLSTGAVVGIVGGVAAAGAGVAVVAKGGDNPEDAETSYSGPVSGQYTVTHTAVGNATNVCTYLRSLSGTMRVTLRQGSASPGDAQLDLTENSISASGTGCSGVGPACCGPQTFVCALTGSAGSLACSQQRSNTSNGITNTLSFTFSGSLSGGVISGVVTYASTGQGTVNISTVSHTGSTSIPVTLR